MQHLKVHETVGVGSTRSRPVKLSENTHLQTFSCACPFLDDVTECHLVIWFVWPSVLAPCSSVLLGVLPLLKRHGRVAGFRRGGELSF